MTILTSRQVYRRPLPATASRAPELDESESAATKRALLFLRTKHGGARKLAAALRVSVATVNRSTSKRGKPMALLALRTARLAGVSVEDVLGGVYPPEGACPQCGRG